jgi:cytochrome c oxidase assembly protein subunit 15
MGSLVGFTALALAIYTTIAERRRWVKVMAWGIGVCILIQAVMGGLRVTDKSTTLAVVHGVFAQMVFAGMASLAVVAGRAYEGLKATERETAGMERGLTALLTGSLVVQLMLGALVRHTNALVMMHILMAAAVGVMALACGFRAWGLHGDIPALKKSGIAVMVVVCLQLMLGVLALVFRSGPLGEPTVGGAFLTTAHQANGAVLLAVSGILMVRVWRSLKPGPRSAELPQASALQRA